MPRIIVLRQHLSRIFATSKIEGSLVAALLGSLKLHPVCVERRAARDRSPARTWMFYSIMELKHSAGEMREFKLHSNVLTRDSRSFQSVR